MQQYNIKYSLPLKKADCLSDCVHGSVFNSELLLQTLCVNLQENYRSFAPTFNENYAVVNIYNACQFYSV